MVSNVSVKSTLIGLFLALGSAVAGAQQTDVIRGRVTNEDGNALQNVRVMATSIPGNVTREVRTDNRGNFQIVFPGGTGDYMVGYALIGYVYRQQQIKRLADEDVLLANASLNVVQLDTIAVVAPVQQRVGRNSSTPDVGGTERRIDTSTLPPELQGDITALAASMPGVLLVPGVEGQPDGFSVLGLGADQNTTTLNGLPLGQNGLPRDANVSTSLTTSPYDVSRGGFSGANVNVRSSSGNNFRTRGMSLVLNTPELQWTDRAGRALGNEYTNVSVGGTVSGPLVLNKTFYNVSYQLGRQSRDNQTLLGVSPVGLQTAGVAADSVTRFIGILSGAGVPGLGGSNPQRLSDNGSLFGSIDVSPPNSTSGQSIGFTFNGNWSKQSPVFGGATQLASASGDQTNWGGGLQARHNAYVKLVLSETSAGFNLSQNHGDPYLSLPLGRVRVTSDLGTGASGVQNLTFGGNQSLSASSRSRSASFQNTLSWFDDANKHRVKLATELQYNSGRQNPASNTLGTFTFNSLQDLEAGNPASFSRTLSVRERQTGHVTASVSLGDSYRRTQDFQLQYGVRVDGTRYLIAPQYNPAVETTFGRRNDRLPTPVGVSPRVGFSWTMGTSDEIQAFFGQARAPRAVIRGGIGLFASTSGTGQLGSAVDNTGLPSGTQQIFCVGSAVPVPDWSAYTNDLSQVPVQCSDGTSGSAFSNSSPNVTLFSSSFKPQRALRSNLSWNGAILDARFTTNIEGSYSLNLNQQRSVDLNFDNVERFRLAYENRPVFVQTGSIVPTSGAIAARDARISSAFARVSEVRSDMMSRSAQVSIRLSPINRRPTSFGWSGSYTFTHVREQVSGFSSTAGSPLDVAWFTSGQGPHQFQYNLRYQFFKAIQVNWNGNFRSGAAYTPMVAGDINGDGYSNDRAYVFAGTRPDIATPYDTVYNAMTTLINTTSARARECLEAQGGRIAARNSCRAPWSSNASLNITLDRARFRMPQRAAISFSVSNPLGAADLLFNGSDNLRGWGQNPSPDAQLLYVRGFDAATRTYRYEVNQRFGQTRPQVLAMRQPVMVTTSVRIDLGPTRERQQVEQNVGAGRNRPGNRMQAQFWRQSGPNSIQNPLSAILRNQDTLRLTATQADSIAVLNRRYTYRADSIWAPVGRYLGALPTSYDMDDAYGRYIAARRAQVDMLIQIAPLVTGLLTPEQRRRLPQSAVAMLDPRYLLSIRSGSNTFVGGMGGFSAGEVFVR
jgi:hypothetical protein